MCNKAVERYFTTYVSKARENVPCNWIAVAVFFVVFTLLDHIRGLGTLIALLILLPQHCNKKDSTAQQPSHPLALCTDNPGIHRSCSALYFWCAANGIIESLALTLHGAVERIYPAWLHVILLFVLWGSTLFVAALLIDSIAPVAKPPFDIESPPPMTRRQLTSVGLAPPE